MRTCTVCGVMLPAAWSEASPRPKTVATLISGRANGTDVTFHEKT